MATGLLDEGNGFKLNVKGASTTAVVGDTSIPVQIHPSSAAITANVGTTNGLALDSTLTGGNLKAQIANQAGVVLNVSGVVTGVQPLDVILGTQSITVADTGSVTSLGFANQPVFSGTPTAGSTAIFNLTSYQSLFVQIMGGWIGTLVSECSTDGGVTWVRTPLRINGTAINGSVFNLNVSGFVNAANNTQYRIRAISLASGTASIRVTLSANLSAISILNPIALSDNASQNSFAIVGANTSTSGMHNSVVVGLSPNSPLPAGSNTLGVVGVNNFPANQQVYGTVNAIIASGIYIDNLTQIGGASITLGQKTATASLPVTIASDQSTLNTSATISNFPATQTVVQSTAANLNATVTGAVTANVGTTNGLALDVTVTNGTQATKLTDGTNTVAVMPAGFLHVTDEPHQIFYDPFDSALDTVARWNAAVSSGGGAAATVTLGVLTIGTGTSANGYSYLTSQPSFRPTIPGWLGDSWAIKIENPVLLNAYRFWGMASVPGAPTLATPITDGYGFEIGIDGKLRAVVYAAGVRIFNADLSASGTNKQPSDGLSHRYIVRYRTDKIFWNIDGISAATQVAVTSAFESPNIQTLPVAMVCIANSSPPSPSATIAVTGLAVWDTAQNAASLSDGTYQWRTSTIKPASTVPTVSDTALVVSMSPNSNVPLSSSSTLSSVTAAASSTSLLGANTSRRGVFIYNDSTATLKVAYAGAASTTSFTVLIAAGGFFEMPQPVYTGALFGIWAAANGAARITELT